MSIRSAERTLVTLEALVHKETWGHIKRLTKIPGHKAML